MARLSTFRDLSAVVVSATVAQSSAPNRSGPELELQLAGTHALLSDTGSVPGPALRSRVLSTEEGL